MKLYFLLICLVIPWVALSQDTVNHTDTSGRKQGFWRKTDENGNTIYEGRFQNGIPLDTFRYYYPDGKISTVSVMSDNGLVARSTSWYRNGQLMARGKYLNQQRDSLWQFFSEYNGSLVSEERWSAGVKNGEERVFYPNGSVSEIINWKDSLREGAWLQFYDDGVMKLRGNYRAGEKDGLVEAWFASGEPLMTGQYKSGHPDGTWTYFDPDGKVKMKEIYENGILLKTTEENTP